MDAFLQTLSHTPSDAERAHLRDLIVVELAEFNQIAHGSPEPFVRERRRRIEAAQLVAAPIAKLPVELLSNIFELVSQESEHFVQTKPQLHRDVDTKLRQHWALIRTSSLWKNVMFSRAHLWTDIEVTVPFHSAGVLQGIAQQAALTNDRFPVRLTVLALTRFVYPQVDIMQAMGTTASALEALELKVQHPEVLRNIFPVPGETTTAQQFPRLRSLTVEFSPPTIYLPPSEYDISFDPRRMLAPWPQLTTLVIDLFFVPMFAAWEILAASTQLEVVRFGIAASLNDMESLPTKPTTLPNLHSASLTFVDMVVPYSRFIDAFTLPALTVFHLGFDASNETMDRSLVNLRTRSSFALEKVSFYDVPLNEAGAWDFLYDMPSLTDISITVIEFDLWEGDFDPFLSIVGTKYRLAPELSVLSIFADPSDLLETNDQSWLIGLVERRQEKLKSVQLSLIGNANPQDWLENEEVQARIEKLRRDNDMTITLE